MEILSGRSAVVLRYLVPCLPSPSLFCGRLSLLLSSQMSPFKHPWLARDSGSGDASHVRVGLQG